MSDRKIRIALIDSGISKAVPSLQDKVIYSTGFHINCEGYIKENKMLPVQNSHGTFIALIISYIYENIEFVSINILDKNLRTDTRVLLSAISQAFEYKPDIIHMSLGTVNKRYWFCFKKVLKEAKKQKVLVVAAAANSGEVSYPAYMHGVLGVKADSNLIEREYRYNNGFFYAPVGVRHIPYIQMIPHNDRACGNSMSAGYITGHLAKILAMVSEDKKWNYRKVKKELINDTLEKER